MFFYLPSPSSTKWVALYPLGNLNKSWFLSHVTISSSGLFGQLTSSMATGPSLLLGKLLQCLSSPSSIGKVERTGSGEGITLPILWGPAQEMTPLTSANSSLITWPSPLQRSLGNAVFSQTAMLPATMLQRERIEEPKLDHQLPTRASQDLIKKAGVTVTFREGFCWIPAATGHDTKPNSPRTRREFRKWFKLPGWLIYWTSWREK